MPEGLDSAAAAFQAAINPSERREPVREAKTPPPVDRMFEAREVEGDPETGDSGDGGDDASLRRAERQVQNGGDDEGQLSDAEVDEEQQDAEDDGEQQDAEGDAQQDTNGQKYEVTVDGHPQEVTLREALDGYIRTETFHQRMNKLNEASSVVRDEAVRVAQMRDAFISMNQQLEVELQSMVPTEPNWDQEYARDPKAAHELQKQYDAVKAKLGEIRNRRAMAEQERANQNARDTEAYAKNEFSRFVMDNKIPDEPTLKKELNAMRKTALAAGFTEQEVTTVYDSRMLNILRKASRYDRMMAAKPKAVNTGGRKATVTPGSSNGAVSRQERKGYDAARKNLEKTGSIDDAADFFRRLIR